MVQIIKNLPAVQEIRFNPWVGKIPWKRKWLPTPVFLPREFHGLSLYICLFQTFYMNGIIYCLVLLSFSIKFSWSSMMQQELVLQFLFYCLILFRSVAVSYVVSLIDGHLSCFYVFTIMNDAAVNIHVEVFLWTYAWS